MGVGFLELLEWRSNTSEGISDKWRCLWWEPGQLLRKQLKHAVKKILRKLNCYIFKYALDAKEAVKEKEKQRSHEVWKTESNLSGCKYSCFNNNIKYEQIRQSKQRQKSADTMLFKKQDPYIHCLWKIHFQFKDTNRLEAKGSERYIWQTAAIKKARTAILISDSVSKTNQKIVFRNKGEHCVMIEGSVY